MKTQDLRAALAAERRRREETEAKLIRALENNGALARVNLRLQEQCARLRGEADLRQHEEGCQRTAAAVREREAAAKLARLQALVQQGEQERAALRRQLAGKQEVIAYLEGKLAERVAGSRLGGSGAGQLGARAGGSSGAVDAASGPQAADTAASSGSGGSAVSADTAAVREVQRRVPRVASEVEEARQEGDGQASASSSPTASCVADELEAADAAAAAGGGGRTAAAGAAAVAAADEEAQQLRPPQPASPVAPTAAVTPAPQKAAQQQADEFSTGGAPPPTAPRTSLRARNSISYAEPSLSRKLRQGDPFTFGAAEGAAAGAGRQRGRARTKPCAHLAAGAAQAGGERREVLPAVSD